MLCFENLAMYYYCILMDNDTMATTSLILQSGKWRTEGLVVEVLIQYEATVIDLLPYQFYSALTLNVT